MKVAAFNWESFQLLNSLYDLSWESISFVGACRVWYELLVPTTAEIAADSISGKFPSGNGTPFRQQIQRTKRNAFLPLLPLLGLFKERQTYEQTTYPRVPSRRMRIPWPLLFMAARLPRSRSKLVELEPALLGSAQAWKEFAPGWAKTSHLEPRLTLLVRVSRSVEHFEVWLREPWRIRHGIYPSRIRFGDHAVILLLLFLGLFYFFFTNWFIVARRVGLMTPVAVALFGVLPPYST